MTNDLVTVVVPVYNVEKYLDRCVNSIVNQTYRNLEIILVDDGSPDNCPAMCDEWAKKDSRIRVIHKQNEGQGVARNVGIENATGDYIYFMDSDDYIDLTTIEKACDLAKQHNADVVCFGLLCVNSSGEIVSRGVPNTAKLIYEGESVYSTFLLELYGKNPINGKESNLRSTLWTHFINKKLIQDSAWRIVSERRILSEDSYSLLKLYRNVRKVCVLPETLYYYCENKRSFSRQYSPERFNKICQYQEEMQKLCRELEYSKEIALRCDESFLSFVVAAMKDEIISKKSLKHKAESVKRIIDNDYFQDVLERHKNDKNSLKKGLLFWASRKKYVSLVNLMLFLQVYIPLRFNKRGNSW